jgi:hypothetical protein
MHLLTNASTKTLILSLSYSCFFSLSESLSKMAMPVTGLGIL